MNTLRPRTKNTKLSPDKAMQEMIDVIDVLRGVYVRETEALGAADAKSFLALQDEKLRAADLYQTKIKEAVARQEELKSANPVLKKRLNEMQQDFRVLSRKNREALERMQRCTHRLNGTLRRAARDAAQKQLAFSYGETGALEGHKRKSISTGVRETA